MNIYQQAIAEVVSKLLEQTNKLPLAQLDQQITGLNVRCHKSKEGPAAHGWLTYKGAIFASSGPKTVADHMSDMEVEDRNHKACIKKPYPAGWDKV